MGFRGAATRLSTVASRVLGRGDPSGLPARPFWVTVDLVATRGKSRCVEFCCWEGSGISSADFY